MRYYSLWAPRISSEEGKALLLALIDIQSRSPYKILLFFRAGIVTRLSLPALGIYWSVLYKLTIILVETGSRAIGDISHNSRKPAPIGSF